MATVTEFGYSSPGTLQLSNVIHSQTSRWRQSSRHSGRFWLRLGEPGSGLQDLVEVWPEGKLLTGAVLRSCFIFWSSLETLCFCLLSGALHCPLVSASLGSLWWYKCGRLWSFKCLLWSSSCGFSFGVFARAQLALLEFFGIYFYCSLWNIWWFSAFPLSFFPSFFKLKLPCFKFSRVIRICCYMLLRGDAMNERCPLCPVLSCPAQLFRTCPCLLVVIGNLPEITRGHKVMYRESFNLINILMISF